jgi:PTS system nitrogen regulatory IIA component
MPTDLSALLQGGVILPLQEASSRKQAIDLLCAALGEATGLSPAAIEAAVMERERLGSTGVGEGVAIPHARLAGIERPVGGFMRLAKGVEFEAIDERPCDLLFMLLAPEGAGAEHLRALAQVSRVFRQVPVREALRKAKTVDEVRAVISKEAVKG